MEYVIKLIGLPESNLKRALAPFGNFLQHLHDHFIPNHRNNYHPHLLGHRSLGLMSGMLVALKIFTLTALSLGPVAPAFSSAITGENIISLTNQSRDQYGLSPLSANGILASAAQTKANDMLAKGYFSHNTPDGKTPWSFIVAAGYNYLTAGENLAVNYTEAENVEDAWMNSPGHKANILNKNFQEIGIGIAQGQYQGHEAIFVVQMFGAPAEQKITLSEEPTKVQTDAVPKPSAPEVKASAPFVENKTSVKAPLLSATIQNNLQQKNSDSAIQTEDLKILDSKITVNEQQASVTAELSGNAVKVLAIYGEQAVMLEPKDNNTWVGSVALGNLAEQNSSMVLKAYDINGNEKISQVAEFSSSTQKNFQPNVTGSVAGISVKFLGKVFNPKIFEQKFYLIFIAALLTCLILAISIHRHIQHLGLIANSSFVVILATLLWMAT